MQIFSRINIYLLADITVITLVFQVETENNVLILTFKHEEKSNVRYAMLN